MRVSKHICFSNEKAPELVEYLHHNKILYNNSHGLLTLDMYQDSSHWPAVQNFVKKKRLVCLSETEFSQEELLSSDWLSVRSQWRCGYPQPEQNFGYQQITYGDENYCKCCGLGLHQVSSFRIKSSPKWGKRHFFMLNWVDDELFLDDVAMGLLSEKKFSGFSFTPVKNKSGTDTLAGIHQLIIESRTPSGFLEGQENIQNILICSVCNGKKYHPSGIGMYSFRKSAFDNMPDICKTSEVFGWGKSAHRLILVRQKVYKAIKEHQLDRGLVFSPIDLV